MPTVVRKDGFSIRIYAPPREHPPPHVHVYKAGDHAIIQLGVGANAVTVLYVMGMASRDVVRAVALVEDHHNILMATWERIHGKTSPD